eukprot:TRINITY_DN8578_c0_g1_i17.p1 TRINITY_DN8578_c0_g1~~TRINITY_DN8578_c0_g1_i17.p1  ORF type:complete len:399 (-),score=75.01 TRINITY_DN8578_c0_g1_i17:49-1080(-)
MSEISPCTRLDFYGLWTVHNYGPNVEEKNPYPWSIIKSHKWLAWKKAGSLTKEESMEAFIMKVIEVLKSLPYTKERQDLLYLLERRKKSPVIVYGDPTDPPCLAVTWLCVLGNIPHDFETITANKIPASFLSISPHAHVPVINDNGFVVSECSSILRYLSAAYRLESRFYPQDLLTRTKIDQYLDWHQVVLRQATKGLFQIIVYNKNKWLEPHVRQMVSKALYSLEMIWLNNETNYISGVTKTSIADLLCFCEVKQLVDWIPWSLQSYPKLLTFMNTMNKLSGHDQVHEKYHQLLRSWQRRVTKTTAITGLAPHDSKNEAEDEEIYFDHSNFPNVLPVVAAKM